MPCLLLTICLGFVLSSFCLYWEWLYDRMHFGHGCKKCNNLWSDIKWLPRSLSKLFCRNILGYWLSVHCLRQIVVLYVAASYLKCSFSKCIIGVSVTYKEAKQASLFPYCLHLNYLQMIRLTRKQRNKSFTRQLTTNLLCKDRSIGLCKSLWVILVKVTPVALGILFCHFRALWTDRMSPFLLWYW